MNKTHDILALLLGSNGVAVLLSHIEVWLKVLIAAATLAFIVLGVAMRSLELRKELRKQQHEDDEETFKDLSDGH